MRHTNWIVTSLLAATMASTGCRRKYQNHDEQPETYASPTETQRTAAGTAAPATEEAAPSATGSTASGESALPMPEHGRARNPTAMENLGSAPGPDDATNVAGAGATTGTPRVVGAPGAVPFASDSGVGVPRDAGGTRDAGIGAGDDAGGTRDAGGIGAGTDAGGMRDAGPGRAFDPGTGEFVEPGVGDYVDPATGETTEPGVGDVTEPGSGETTAPGSGETPAPGSGDATTLPP